MSNRISKDKRQEIVDYLKEGHSQTAAKKKFNTTATTIATIARENGIKPKEENLKRTEAARKAHIYYSKQNRVKAWDTVFEQCMVMLKDEELSPFGFQKIVASLGIATDKLRLEEDKGGSEGKAAILMMMDEIKRDSQTNGKTSGDNTSS